MVIAGSALTAALCKPLFALVGPVRRALGPAACVAWIGGAQALDQTFRGLREAPTKALVGQLAAESGRPGAAAAAFSLRQALSTAGMLLGAGSAALAFRLTGGRYEGAFALSTLPAALGAALVAASLGGRSSAGSSPSPSTADPAADEGERVGLLQKAAALLRVLPPSYWQALCVACLLWLAKFDVAFRTVHAASVRCEGTAAAHADASLWVHACGTAPLPLPACRSWTLPACPSSCSSQWRQ